MALAPLCCALVVSAFDIAFRFSGMHCDGVQRHGRDSFANMKTLGRVLLITVTVYLLVQAVRLIVLAFKRTDAPARIIGEAAIYLVVMLIVSRLYRRL